MAYEAFFSSGKDQPLISMVFPNSEGWQRIQPDPEGPEAEMLTIACSEEDILRVYIGKIMWPSRKFVTQIASESQSFVDPNKTTVFAESKEKEPRLKVNFYDTHEGTLQPVIFRHIEIAPLSSHIKSVGGSLWTPSFN